MLGGSVNNPKSWSIKEQSRLVLPGICYRCCPARWVILAFLARPYLRRCGGKIWMGKVESKKF